MIIAIDCDNVLNNLQETIINIFNERYGASYTMDDFKKYNISECINKEDAIKMLALYSEPGIYDSVYPLSDAQTVVQKLIRMGHEVYVVTDSPVSIFEEKVHWIKYYFPDIDDAHIICMKHKWLLKCDIMIDDNMDNLLGGYHYDRVCVDCPWNRHMRDEVYGVYRVSDLTQMLDIVNKINKEE